MDDDGILLYAPFESFGMIQKELEKRNLEILSSGFERIPQVLKSLDSKAQEEVLQTHRKNRRRRRRSKRVSHFRNKGIIKNYFLSNTPLHP